MYSIFFITFLLSTFFNYGMEQDDVSSRDDDHSHETNPACQVPSLASLARAVMAHSHIPRLSKVLAKWKDGGKLYTKDKDFEIIIVKIGSSEEEFAYIYEEELKNIAKNPLAMRKFIQFLWLYCFTNKHQFPILHKHLLYGKALRFLPAPTLKCAKEIGFMVQDPERQSFVNTADISSYFFIDLNHRENNILQPDIHTLNCDYSITHFPLCLGQENDFEKKFKILNESSSISQTSSSDNHGTWNEVSIITNRGMHKTEYSYYSPHNRISTDSTTQIVKFRLHIIEDNRGPTVIKEVTFSNPLTIQEAPKEIIINKITCKDTYHSKKHKSQGFLRTPLIDQTYIATLKDGILTSDGDQWIDFDTAIPPTTYTTLTPAGLILVCKAITSCLPGHKRFSVNSDFWNKHSTRLPKELLALVVQRKKKSVLDLFKLN